MDSIKSVIKNVPDYEYFKTVDELKGQGGYKKSEVLGQRYEDQDRSENLTIRHLNSIQNLGLKFFRPATTNRCLRLVQDQIPKQVRDDNERDD